MCCICILTDAVWRKYGVFLILIPFHPPIAPPFHAMHRSWITLHNWRFPLAPSHLLAAAAAATLLIYVVTGKGRNGMGEDRKGLNGWMNSDWMCGRIQMRATYGNHLLQSSPISLTNQLTNSAASVSLLNFSSTPQQEQLPGRFTHSRTKVTCVFTPPNNVTQPALLVISITLLYTFCHSSTM